jgi:3',5'-cyclic AMP phosphodiesterase CpdA
MRTIVHLSDLHFGRVDHTLVEPLLEAVQSVDPDVTAVSGDLTQHAFEREFLAASAFLRRLPGKLIVVPGNHDMAFLNPWKRATQRLRMFRQLITNDAEPFLVDDEIAVLGLNTARVTHLRDGRIREWQIGRLEEKMASVTHSGTRILVTHHPFDLPTIFPASEIVGSGARFFRRVVSCIDLMLAGHMHVSHAGPTAMRYNIGGESAIFVQAGTALSTRTRTEENAFQVIRTSPGAIEVQQYTSSADSFAPGEARVFRKEQGSWSAASHSELQSRVPTMP